MKKLSVLLLAAVTLILVSCMSSIMPVKNQLATTPWELEYITGPRIAFEGLFPDKKPMIAFNPATMNVSGNSGCNGYSADYKMAGNTISFGEPEMSTMMFCGEGEQVFRNTMKKINKYSIDANGKLNLMMNDVPMMRFKRAIAR